VRGFGRGSSGGTIRGRVRNDDGAGGGADGALVREGEAAGVFVRVSEMSIPVGNSDSACG